MAKSLIIPPAGFPVTLAKVKEFLKVENTDDDQLITDLIAQAVAHIENVTARKFITQTWRLFFDQLPQNGHLELNPAPVSSLVEVRYFDGEGNAQTISPAHYEFDIHSTPARIFLKTTVCSGQNLNGIEVDVEAGYGASGVDVPGDILRAILVTIAHWYEFRGAVHPSHQPVSNPAGLSDLLAPYRKANL